MKPTERAVEAALAAYRGVQADDFDHDEGIRAAVDAANRVDKPGGRSMEVAVAVGLLATWLVILGNLTAWLWS